MTIIPFPETQQESCSKATEWLTLPVAPQAAARIRFCGEDKLPQAIPLHGALAWITDLSAHGKSIAGLNIHGPGDPLATMTMTQDIISMLREQSPGLPLGLTTLGIGLARHAGRFAEQGVTKVTLLVDGVTPQTVQNLYAWIRPGKRNMPMAKGAEILIDEQTKGIAACKATGIPVAIRTTVYAGINEPEIEKIARLVSDLGAESITLLPGKGWLTSEEKLLPPSAATMADLAQKVSRYLKVVCLHMPEAGNDIIPPACAGATIIPKPTKERPNVAVLSANGMDIDLHLGQAIKALIYGPREDGLTCLLETRDLPEPGSGDTRWQQVAGILNDCFVLLATSAGQKPREILGRHGLNLLLMEDNVEGTVDVLFGGGKKGKCKK